jgi:hypothetical protein
MMSRIDSWHWKISTGCHFQNGQPQYRTNSTLSDFNAISYVGNFSMSGINSGHHYLPTYQFFMISDNVEYLQYCGDHSENGDTGRNFSMSQSIRDIIIYPHTISTPFHMWVDYDVPNWFLTSKNFYRSPFSEWSPQYCKYSTLSDIKCWESIRDIIIYPHVKFWWYQAMLNFYRPFFIPCFGSHFENGRHLENFENGDL